MKKILILAFAVLALVLALVSCGKDVPTTTQPAVNNPPAHVHSPGAWVTVKAPSCQDGEQTQFCTTCGEVLQTLPIAATGVHNEMIDKAVAPTCTSTGLTEGRHCMSCGKTFVAQVEVPKIAHSYDDEKDETCNECGFVRDVTCKHTDVTISQSKDATCTEAGLTEGIVCNGCEEILQKQEVLEALGHIEITDAGREATCTEAGLTEGKHCSRCGEILVAQSYIKALGHNEGEWVIEKEPTETEDGYKYKKCSVCKEKTQEEIIPFIGDLGLDYTVNADGKTCTITGIGTFEGTKLDIPEYIRQYKVTDLAENAFADCTQLTEINLPETLKTIGIRAFYGCTGITEITIPESVTSIGTQIFYKADNLHTVYYNSTYGSSSNTFMSIASINKVVFGGKKVPNYVLYNCANIETVEFLPNVTSIGHGAFYGCTSLTSVEIPDSVSSMGDDAFYGCTSLTSVEIPDSVSSMGDDAFYGCTSLTNVVIPDSVTSIGSYAFYNCTSLTSVVIPDSVTSIGDHTFYYCLSLTSVVIPDSVTSIETGTFADCTSLTSVVISDSVTSIGVAAFQDCTSLTSVVIPDSVTSIDTRAFNYCTSLASVEIPDSVTSIGEGAFNYCTSLTIYCEAPSKPAGWDSDWNVYNCPVAWGGATEVNLVPYTITFDSIDNRTEFSATQQVWNANGITVTNNKDKSSADMGDYYGPVRFYKYSQLIVNAKNILKIEFVCSTEDYALALVASLSNSIEYSVNGNVVTITLRQFTDRFEIASLMGGKVYVDSITVYTVE